MPVYTADELATMSYYNDAVFGERIQSALRDFRFIPFFNPSISSSAFEPRILRLAAAAVARYSEARDFKLPQAATIWQIVSALQTLATELQLEFEAQQAARYAGKRRR